MLAAVDGDKVQLVAGVTADSVAKVKAGELVNFVAQQVGGKGGGKPDRGSGFLLICLVPGVVYATARLAGRAAVKLGTASQITFSPPFVVLPRCLSNCAVPGYAGAGPCRCGCLGWMRLQALMALNADWSGLPPDEF